LEKFDCYFCWVPTVRVGIRRTKMGTTTNGRQIQSGLGWLPRAAITRVAALGPNAGDSLAQIPAYTGRGWRSLLSLPEPCHETTPLARPVATPPGPFLAT
jgi:hypothetical protein